MAKRIGRTSPRAPDLNLLVILDALLDERSVTGAARRLGVTQSAVSHALGRLRGHFGDPLFVRTSSGMTPTQRAHELREPIRRSLETLREVSQRGARFEPRTAVRTFTIAATDQVGIVLLPALYARLSKDAPRIDLRVTPVVRNVERALESGTADLVISGAFAPPEAPGLFRQQLFDEPLVCLVRAGHPAVGDKVTLEQFCALPHALVAPRGGRGILDDLLEQRGLSRRVAVVLPHFLVAPFLIARSDLVLTVAESVAKAFTSFLPVRLVAPPIELPRATYSQLWHERSHHDAGHAWLRRRVVEASAARAGDRLERGSEHDPEPGSRPAAAEAPIRS
jgi:DNA-binding transcriptional LysR family regulator